MLIMASEDLHWVIWNYKPLFICDMWRKPHLPQKDAHILMVRIQIRYVNGKEKSGF